MKDLNQYVDIYKEQLKKVIFKKPTLDLLSL